MDEAPGGQFAVGGGGAVEDFGGLIEVAEGGGDAPDAERGIPAAEACEAELGLDAALGADEFVPFVDDDAAEGGEFFAGVGVAEE